MPDDTRTRSLVARVPERACSITLPVTEAFASEKIEQQLIVARATMGRVPVRFPADTLAALLHKPRPTGRWKVTPEVLPRLEESLDR